VGRCCADWPICLSCSDHIGKTKCRWHRENNGDICNRMLRFQLVRAAIAQSTSSIFYCLSYIGSSSLVYRDSVAAFGDSGIPSPSKGISSQHGKAYAAERFPPFSGGKAVPTTRPMASDFAGQNGLHCSGRLMYQCMWQMSKTHN
jgi:hypothetical protein